MAVSSNTPRNLHYHKVCITGQPGVGKTSFFNRIRTGRFQQEVSTSLGIDTHEVIRTVKDKDLGVIFHDTGGQEYYGTVSQNYYRNAGVVIYMFAYDDILTLEGLFIHAEEAQRYARDYCYYFLVCNKCELENDVIDKEIIDSKRDLLECSSVFYISALTGEGVENLVNAVFDQIGRLDFADFGESIKLSERDKVTSKNSSKCCRVT